MRNKWVIGNWKLNPELIEARALLNALKSKYTASNVNVGVAPTALHILTAVDALLESPIQVVAQHISTVSGFGAYTGELSAKLMVDAGVHSTLVGHSERRTLFAETEEAIRQKIQHAFAANMTVILCVGETLAEREAGQAKTVVFQQLAAQLSVLDLQKLDVNKLIIAYEPVWAIGTGLTASPADAQSMHADIRDYLKKGAEKLTSISILYGGSVKSDNAAALAGCKDIDGVLVGGASLDAHAFCSIIQAFV